MVDEWSFEFLPGNSSLIFRIILPSNFAELRGSQRPQLNDFPLLQPRKYAGKFYILNNMYIYIYIFFFFFYKLIKLLCILLLCESSHLYGAYIYLKAERL